MDLKKYFVKAPLIPTIIQEHETKRVLMLAYMNEESLKKTIETGYTWFYSRSRGELWNKGATSGNVQRVITITGDCDDDTLLIQVNQTGSACHTGEKSCFYREAGVADFRSKEDSKSDPKEDSMEERYGLPECMNDTVKESSSSEVLDELYKVVMERKKTFSENSYTCYLFEKGLDKILKKCGEECSEVIIAAKNTSFLTGIERDESQIEIKNEICDLLYHLTVLMVNEGISLEDIYDILKQRSRKIGNLKTFHQSDHNS
ncbi:MAG TPA: bifunctional phosphoribosyl-AMP cyclohydrolase/phosphoribosyl-ATP diphosphatase HisIE [Clostridiales bacterium]|nr:bifunctional phosphoribosyl-AMP cyclohydrolase/phosphoribosyl-ATP diphosphatase HisIE [Clostridiales bacterium]